ncbi:hypothetical protein [Pseudoxanthomonas suwonensis]|uniref:hypothetical protein n=1 Tax=Pseudoxanthomonas suwonensis TaxID=314722 RepID=UPI0012DD0D35|nr:hypothetical protein [Pseudoxanthomonas suwonensis]
MEQALETRDLPYGGVLADGTIAPIDSMAKLLSHGGDLLDTSGLADSWAGIVQMKASTQAHRGNQEVNRALQASSQLLASRRVDVVSGVDVQFWEGIVLDVEDDEITVRLTDKTSGQPDCEASLSLSEVDEEDRDLVREGAVFYWHVGYEMRPSGRKRSSMIRFRRMPAWTKTDLKRVENRADELFKRLSSAQV